jgi:hypothetical protein
VLRQAKEAQQFNPQRSAPDPAIDATVATAAYSMLLLSQPFSIQVLRLCPAALILIGIKDASKSVKMPTDDAGPASSSVVRV